MDFSVATEKAFTSYDVQACLYDERRVEHLRAAIEAVVRAGDVVVDCGSGTGLLGMLAIRAGARRAYCLEINSEFIPVIRANAARNGMSGKLIAMQGDATLARLPEPVDVVISEVISAGFFYEPQLQIVDNLRRCLKPGGRMLPAAMSNYLELIDAQDTLYGLTFNYDSRFRDLAGDEVLTDRGRYLARDFATDSGSSISSEARVRAAKAGRANAVRITYDIEFAPGIHADKPTEFLLNPQIVFLREPVALEPDRRYRVAIKYEASSSPLDCAIDVQPLWD